MSVPLYEFTGEDTPRPRSKWLIAVVVLPVVVAAVWALVRWQRVRTERLVNESFELKTDLHNEVIIAIAQVPELPEECVRFLANYPRLQVVDLSGTTTVPGGLRPLLEIDDLNVLSLRGCAWVDDEQAVWLSELTDLKQLNLSGTHVTDAALLTISELPRLSELKLQHCEGITDAGLEICAGMDQLRELWPGGSGYSLADLVTLRERRRDLTLQVNPSAVRLSTTEDIQALSDLLRLNQNWGFGNPFQISHGGDVEPIEETWTSLELHGPAAGQSLITAFPLMPKLTALSLHDTKITTEEFPFDLVPPGLRRLHIANTRISDSFLRTLNQHTALEQLRLTDVAIDGVDPAMGHYTTLELIHVGDISVNGVGDERRTYVQFRGPVAGRSLANVFPLTPKLTDLTLRDTTIATDQFPFDLVPPGLRRLTIWNTPVSASFFRILSQYTALERLSLTDVAVSGVNLPIDRDTSADDFPIDSVLPRLRRLDIANVAVSEPFLRILSQHTGLKVLMLTDVVIDGVDPAMEHGTTLELIFDLVPPGLRQLDIANAQINESFLRGLSQHTALEELWLREVAVEGVDLTDPAFGHLTTLRSMLLTDVTVDGVDLTDPALEPLTARLREQLARTWVSISSSTSDKSIQWSNPYAWDTPLRVTRTETSD